MFASHYIILLQASTFTKEGQSVRVNFAAIYVHIHINRYTHIRIYSCVCKLEVPQDLTSVILLHLWRCVPFWPWSFQSRPSTDVSEHYTCQLFVVPSTAYLLPSCLMCSCTKSGGGGTCHAGCLSSHEVHGVLTHSMSAA